MSTATVPQMKLNAGIARDVMSPDPISVRRDANFTDVLAFFIDRNITAAPVIDDSGRQMGVISVTDLIVHLRNDLKKCEAGNLSNSSSVTAGQLMTPTFFSVSYDTPIEQVVRDMINTRVHHLFVTDDHGEVVGVISTSDILRRLS